MIIVNWIRLAATILLFFRIEVAIVYFKIIAKIIYISLNINFAKMGLENIFKYQIRKSQGDLKVKFLRWQLCDDFCKVW